MSEQAAVSVQFRYRMYAADHGLSPDAMLASDDARWPGGVMCGFLLWVNDRWREWGGDRVTGQDEFDAWLRSRSTTEGP